MTSQYLVEIYEEPGWIDDGFRTGWSLTSGGGTLANGGTIAGDYAVLTPTEGTPLQVAFSKTLESALSSNTYPVLRIRVKGAHADAQCAVVLWFTGGGGSQTLAYFKPGTEYMVKSLHITPDKNIGTVQIWAKDYAVDWDYVAILMNPPLLPEEIEELEVDLQTTIGVSGFKISLLNDPLFGITMLRLPLNENFGTRAYDLSRYKNHGAVSGASWVDGKYRKALDFEADDTDYVEVDDNDSLDFGADEDFTIAAWIKAETWASYRYLLIKSTLIAANKGYGVAFEFDGKSYIMINDGTYAEYEHVGSALQIGTWYHVVFTWDRDGNLMRYINGVADGTADISARSGDLSNIHPLLIGCFNKSSGWFDGIIDELRIYRRLLTTEEIYQLYVSSPLSGAVRAGVGDICMIYLAGDGESLDEKIIKGRVIDRERKGEPDNPIIEIVGEEMGELLHERDYTDEFATATQISEIVKDIIDDSFDEFTHASVDTTNITIKNKFDKEGVFDLLKKLGESAVYGDGTKGANFWVDPGDDLHFEKVGKWSGPDITDGSDGGTKNILDISMKETMKGNPPLANDLKLVIMESEHIPSNQDGWTDVDTEGDEEIGWFAAGTWVSSYVTVGVSSSDVKAGDNSINYLVLAQDPGEEITEMHMRLVLPNKADISKMDKVRFWLKRTTGINIDGDGVEIYLNSKTAWPGKYYGKTGLAPPSADTWYEYELNISDFTKTNKPSEQINRIGITVKASGGIGSGNIRIDKFRFESSEKAKTAEDSTSISKYGRRKETIVDKTITDEDYAQKVMDGMLEHRKRHTVHARIRVPGKAQMGYRPPQKVKVTSLKDGIDGEYFQIVSAKHRLKPEDIYSCDLEIVTGINADGTYHLYIYPQPNPDFVWEQMVRQRFHMRRAELSMLKREWEQI